MDSRATALATPLNELDAQGLRRILRGRRSIRRYGSGAVASGVIIELLEAAVTAPSPHNRQPWRFVVIQRTETRQRLALAMGARLRHDRLRDGDPIDAVERDVARSYGRLSGAPVLIVVCTTFAEMDRYPDAERNQREQIMAIQATAMAGQNLMLAAHAANLGSCWMCAPLFCPDVVSRVLALPDGWQPQGIVTIGHPGDTGKPFARRRLDDIVVYEEPAP
jgi:coenzyme F420-0:L-glutamate ligase/coenzyme F420-1:gamma-L-glutamate ligase